jgi:hypothetical protein
MTDDKEYFATMLKVISDPRFRLFGFTRQEILLVRERMDIWAVLNVNEILRPKP